MRLRLGTITNVIPTGKITTIEKPWVIKDDNGAPSYSLLPPAVVVGLIDQVCKNPPRITMDLDPRLHFVTATAIIEKDGKFLIVKRRSPRRRFPANGPCLAENWSIKNIRICRTRAIGRMVRHDGMACA